MNLVKHTRPKRYFYARNVNMLYSFDKLHEMAAKLLGAEVEVGDILICDNKNQTKRKVLQMTKEGFMIHYGRLSGQNKFGPLKPHDGIITDIKRSVL